MAAMAWVAVASFLIGMIVMAYIKGCPAEADPVLSNAPPDTVDLDRMAELLNQHDDAANEVRGFPGPRESAKYTKEDQEIYDLVFFRYLQCDALLSEFLITNSRNIFNELYQSRKSALDAVASENSENRHN